MPLGGPAADRVTLYTHDNLSQVTSVQVYEGSTLRADSAMEYDAAGRVNRCARPRGYEAVRVVGAAAGPGPRAGFEQAAVSRVCQVGSSPFTSTRGAHVPTVDFADRFPTSSHQSRRLHRGVDDRAAARAGRARPDFAQ